MDYIYRAYDRLINKSRGLLAFCGLLFTSFGLIAQHLPESEKTSWPTLAAGLLPLIASVPLLFLFWMNWGAAKDYVSNDSDFNSMIVATQHRTWLLAISVWITLVDVALLAYLIYEWLH